VNHISDSVSRDWSPLDSHLPPVTRHLSPVTRLLLWSLAFNLPLTLLGLQRRSFDYYSHLFFADHHRLRWWDLWEPRWYTGFSVASYPPLVHQLIALLSRLVAPRFIAEPAERLLGLQFGYGLVQLAALLLFPLAVRSFAGQFVGPAAARRAGLLAIFFPGISLAAYAFGQLPTVVASMAGLFALSRGGQYLRTGETGRLIQALLFVGIAAGAHHAVFLLLPWAGLAVAGRALLAVQPAPVRRMVLLRTAIWAGLSIGVAVFVLWPFVNWSRGYEPQTPIDHPSRHNFLTDSAARLFFFWPMYGWLIAFLPLLVYLPASRRRLAPLGGAGAALFVLGLGGTTPLPAVIFGSDWQWLTYDRFALWAGICLLPLVGLGWTLVERRSRQGHWPGLRSPEHRRAAGALLLGGFACIAAFSASFSIIMHSQPPEVDMQPIVSFLEVGDRSAWRYYTFGFGDQMAKLSILAPATTPDGSYHTARSIPEHRQSGIGQIDGALWSDQGVDGSYVFVQGAARWGVRWAFVNHEAYAPLLKMAGWHYRERLSNGVNVWELDSIPPRARQMTPKRGTSVTWASLWWGEVHMLLLFAMMLLGVWQLGRRQAQGGSHKLC